MIPLQAPARRTEHGVPLNDEQVARFITDGYLVLNAGIAAEAHAAIYRKLDWVLQKEGNPGNNILPAVPELQEILDSPTVRGALTGVLGPNYVLHPHRYVHNNEPGEMTAEGAKIGKGSHSFVGWHQDDHSPLSRPRHHAPRYAMLLYYPQDTPLTLGPTQIIPATHLHRRITQEDYERGFQAAGSAGACVLVHFDLAHGGSLNLGDHTRYMVKLVFARTEEPQEPSWDFRQPAWQTPAGHQAPYESTVVWSHLWNWMWGRQGRNCVPVSGVKMQLSALLERLSEERPTAERIAAINEIALLGAEAAAAVPTLIAALEGEEYVRQNALYALAAIGAPAAAPLCAELARHEESHWNEGAVVMESSAYALAAIGCPAMNALLPLLENPSEWVQINALFALGEMGQQAREAVPALLAKLRSGSQAVVRMALDALGQIGADEESALPALIPLFTVQNPDWQARIRRDWCGADQIRINAMMALLRLGWRSERATKFVAAALHDPCGYVTGFGIECLLRHGTQQGVTRALECLLMHRWDDTLRKGVRTF